MKFVKIAGVTTIVVTCPGHSRRYAGLCSEAHADRYSLVEFDAEHDAGKRRRAV